jgi:hypothetical protein
MVCGCICLLCRDASQRWQVLTEHLASGTAMTRQQVCCCMPWFGYSVMRYGCNEYDYLLVLRYVCHLWLHVL